MVQGKYRSANGARGDGHRVSSGGGVFVSDVAARRARAWALRRRRFSRSAAARRCSRSARSSLLGRGGPAGVLLMHTMKNGMNSARQAVLASRAAVVRWSGNIGAAVAQGQSTPLVRVGSVVQFHSAAPSLTRVACPAKTFRLERHLQRSALRSPGKRLSSQRTFRLEGASPRQTALGAAPLSLGELAVVARGHAIAATLPAAP
jgi:hypothetical protein